MYQRDDLWLLNDFMIDPAPLAFTFAQLAIAKGYVGTKTWTSNFTKIHMIKIGVPDTFNFSLSPDNWIDNYVITSGSNGHSIALAGAAYGEVLGYERSLFFKPDEAGKKDFEDLSKQGTFGKARLSNTVKKEYNAYNIIYKYELKSANRSVVNFLQVLCANNIDKPVGTVVHTGMLNEQVGYESISFFCLDILLNELFELNVWYPSWRHYINKKTTPFYLNQEYHISFDKNFIGKVASLKQKQDGIQKRFVQFLLEDHNLDLGFVHAPSLKKITVNYIRGATYETNIATKRLKAHPNVYQPTEMGRTVLLYTN
ncbi:unnamed protein product [Adineta steineri]|uniref:Uncharacterized protein n=1 Tax=Adineta steineri TaxID=433720 RepID=A0A816B5S7_9BILA|nr:unnamed protein product [Adineta steineri]CAF1606577.1 unnamed protein product [Adineta steineri]